MKENWKIPLLFVWTIFIWAWSRKNGAAAMEVLEARKESYENQIVKLKENHNRELSDRDQEIKQYQETLENIEKKYKNKSVKINTVTKKRVKEIVKQSKGDSDAVKQKIEELFNLPSLD